MKTSNASKASGQWYFEMANKIDSTRVELIKIRIKIDKIYRYEIIMQSARVFALPLLTCFIKAVKKSLEISVKEIKSRKLLKNK